MTRIAQFSDLHYSAKNLTEADRCFGQAIDRAIEMRVEAAVISATRPTTRSTSMRPRSNAWRGM
jgi:hypothetical protein